MNNNNLKYWHKLEHFYPYIIQDQNNKNIESFAVKDASTYDKCFVSDEKDEREVRYYEIYFGIFKVRGALNEIASKLCVKNEMQYDGEDTSCFCKIRLTGGGSFDGENSKISSFPWAIQRISEGKIEVDKWDEDFAEYQKSIFYPLICLEGSIQFDSLEKLRDDVIDGLDWKIDFCEYWMRIDKIKGEPVSNNEINGKSNESISREERQDREKEIDKIVQNNDLLNSFYVRDLERVIAYNGIEGNALKNYLVGKTDIQIDVENNAEELTKLFNPKLMPFGKWPSGYSLRAMQQVSVNAALCKGDSVSNIFAVNGPPGTGKTTLLRDIVAGNVVSRAQIMYEYNEPNDIFNGQVEKSKINGYSSYFREVDERLRQYGMLVASNNNAAVANITKEMPDITSIAPKYREKYQYFSEVSNNVLGRETWGICAAALGSKKKRRAFADKFWPSPFSENVKYDFGEYLKNMLKKENRDQVKYLSNWKRAKDNFKNAENKVRDAYNELGKCYEEIRVTQGIKNKVEENKEKINSIQNEKREQIGEYEKKSCELQENIENREKSNCRMAQIRKNIFLFHLKHFFHIKTDVLLKYYEIESNIQKMLFESFDLEDAIDGLKNAIEDMQDELKKLDCLNKALCIEIEKSEKKIALVRDKYDICIPNKKYVDDLIGKNGEARRREAHECAPWNSDKINELREILFLESMNLHKALIENSTFYYQQLELAIERFVLDKKDKDTNKKHSDWLLQTLFIIIPVLSTTFASLGNMLKYIGCEKIGLLLIDEAGQAVPQSAVGALWRSKRAIVVGDPLQIEPIMTVHDKTISCLQQYYGVSDFFVSKETSAQSIADRICKYVGYRESNENKYCVGTPLLIHGRCQRPMFEIANEIAYNNKMIYGTKNVPDICCQWLNVQGSAKNKHFVPEQVKRCIDIVKEQFDAAWGDMGQEVGIPSLFIITPFKSVKEGIVRMFSENEMLIEKCHADTVEKKRKAKEWIRTCVGTVHTFQGKEADTVIFCLGVDSSGKSLGAIQWATQSPNILNVAVTRAKNKFYIVGDKSLWETRNYFKVAAKICEEK